MAKIFILLILHALHTCQVFFGPHPRIDALFENKGGLTEADFAEIQALAEKWNAEEWHRKLPFIFINGGLVGTGMYPSRNHLAQVLDLATGAFSEKLLGDSLLVAVPMEIARPTHENESFHL
jgi:hypothetical protein